MTHKTTINGIPKPSPSPSARRSLLSLSPVTVFPETGDGEDEDGAVEEDEAIATEDVEGDGVEVEYDETEDEKLIRGGVDVMLKLCDRKAGGRNAVLLKSQP